MTGSAAPLEPHIQEGRRGMGLTVSGLAAAYWPSVQALRSVDLTVEPGEIVALLGANGAGKTTFLRAVTGLLSMHRGRVTAGEARFDGARIDDADPADIVALGIGQTMEGRRIFRRLTVHENLLAGALSTTDKKKTRAQLDATYARFPMLAERRESAAGYLSGGQQQVLAVGRALMAQPRLLLMDEPSLGLAPIVVEQIRDLVSEIRDAGTSVLLVEQNATMALSIADRAFVLESGRVVQAGTAAALRNDAGIRDHYLGIGSSDDQAFRPSASPLPARTQVIGNFGRRSTLDTR